MKRRMMILVLLVCSILVSGAATALADSPQESKAADAIEVLHDIPFLLKYTLSHGRVYTTMHEQIMNGIELTRTYLP